MKVVTEPNPMTLSSPESPVILIVDDDPSIRRLVTRYLSGEGFNVLEAADGPQMFEVLKTATPQVVVMDVVMPGDDGFTLVRHLRQEYGNSLGIVMLTSKADVVDRVVGLEIGADDYVPKPFELRELLARIRSVTRRQESMSDRPSESPKTARFENLVAHLDSMEVFTDQGEALHLTTKEFRLLNEFVMNSRKVLTREALLSSLSNRDWTPYDRSIDVLVLQLRRKLAEFAAGDESMIKTVRGSGYMFLPHVEIAS